MKKYKIWLQIEELDEETGSYHDIADAIHSLGEEFETFEDAVSVLDDIVCNYYRTYSSQQEAD